MTSNEPQPVPQPAARPRDDDSPAGIQDRTPPWTVTSMAVPSARLVNVTRGSAA
jgi:hypothetical protein